MRKEYIAQLKAKSAEGDLAASKALDRHRERDRLRKKHIYERAALGDLAASASVERKQARMRAYQKEKLEVPTIENPVCGSISHRVMRILAGLLSKFR